MSNNIYNILGKLKTLTESAEPAAPEATVYENVEPRGSITEAVRSLEGKYAAFKEAKAKPDFLDVDKDGDKKEPFKKAVKDKEAVNEVFSDEEAKAQRDATKDRAWKAKGEANTKKYEKNKKASEKRAQERAAKKNVAEAAYDEPEAPDADAIAKRKRLQAIKDRQEDERAERGENKPESNVKIHKGTYGNEYKGDADLDEGTIAKPKKDLKKHSATAKRMAMQKKADKDHESWLDQLEKTDPDHPSLKYRKQAQVAEVAPPGAKAERMVKHIKKGYSKDGNLSKKEKGIAYATAWKAKKAGSLEEGTEFKDAGKIKNSALNMKKAKLAKVTESRMLQEGDYFYEKIGKALAEKDPTLDTANPNFVSAVRQEMIAQGIEPNRARNIIAIDEDFISDVASSYAHYCKEVSEAHAPMNSHLGGASELDEIARLAGLPVQETDMVYNEVNHDESFDTMDEAVTDDEDARRLAHYHELVAGGEDPDDAEMMAFNDEGSEELDEEDMAEGNEFSGALAAAKAAGAKEFEVDGKRYTVKEDININITASGEQDALNLIRKLSGMDEVEAQPALRNIGPVMDAESAIAQGIVEPVEEERDIEYVNTPNEKIGPISAAIPSGNDLHKSKQSYSDKPYRGDNPMAVKEDTLWKKYAGMLKGLIK